MSIYRRQTGRNTLRGLFVATTVAAIAVSLAGCQAKQGGSRSCSCTCRAKTAGGSTIIASQTFLSNDTCGASEGAACTYTGTYNGTSFTATGALEKCGDTRPTGAGPIIEGPIIMEGPPMAKQF